MIKCSVFQRDKKSSFLENISHHSYCFFCFVFFWNGQLQLVALCWSANFLPWFSCNLTSCLIASYKMIKTSPHCFPLLVGFRTCQLWHTTSCSSCNPDQKELVGSLIICHHSAFALAQNCCILFSNLIYLSQD